MVAPTPEQKAALESAKALALAGVAGSDGKILAFEQAAAEQQKIDDFMKANFDQFNDKIVRQYELERRKIDGRDLASPIVEQDLLDFVHKNSSGRLWNGGAFEPLRIPEFDGSPLEHIDEDNETDLFPPQTAAIDKLVNGIPGQILLTNVFTDSDLTASSTTLKLKSTTAFTVNVNDCILIRTGSDCSIVKVKSFSGGGGSCAGEIPPGSGTTEPLCIANGGTWTSLPLDVEIDILITPTGTIPSGTAAGVDRFLGFNNTERHNHIASLPGNQTIMNQLLAELQAVLERRKTTLTSEKLAYDTNENVNKNPSIEGLLQSAQTRVENLLGTSAPDTIVIDDDGIILFNNDKTTRQGELSQRLTEIPTEITAGNFYNQRYGFAVNRVQLINGSLSLTEQLKNAKAGAEAGKASAQGLADRYSNYV